MSSLKCPWHRCVGVSVAALASALMAAPAQAANFCVGSRSQAQAALDASVDNGQVDIIRFRAGVIDIFQALQFDSSEPSDQLAVTLTGGFNADCSQRSGETVLDGNGVSPILDLEMRNSQSLLIDRLTFLRARNTSYGASVRAILYATNGNPNLRIDNSKFLLGESEGQSSSSGALFISGAGTVRVRNNLFVGNMAETSPAAYINLDGTGYIVGNTVTGNVVTDGDGPAFSLIAVNATSRFWVSNNIFWGNDTDRDLNLFGESRFTLVTNNIGLRNSITLLPGSIGNLSVDPAFASCGFVCIDRALRRSSPLVDAGTNTPEGGMTLIDITGSDRTVGSAVDIGAYELERLFSSGFE